MASLGGVVDIDSEASGALLVVVSKVGYARGYGLVVINLCHVLAPFSGHNGPPADVVHDGPQVGVKLLRQA